MLKTRSNLLAIAVVHCVVAATHADEQAIELSPEKIEFFERRVRPILVERCHKCHSQQAKKLEGNLRLDERQSILTGGDLGPAVVPEEPASSLLVQAIRYGGELQMPPDGKLSETEIGTLTKWVELGIPMPSGSATSSSSPPRPIRVEQGRHFWSFRPLRKHVPPATSPWARTRIDTFLLDAMSKQGLEPAAPADRRVLIRRATLDLLGVPPAPEEVAVFADDERPDAFERLIDRLLASPQYGERWGRYWLDYARYADRTASWLNRLDGAFLYRDWVVRALNDDVPYDDFVKRQLATDRMPSTPPEDNAALGFLGLSPTYWKELRLDHTLIKTVVGAEWEDRIDAVCGTFLGLTVACARCHDHKFDPITTDDYYALAGVFASSSLAEVPTIAEPQATRVAEARKRVEQLEQQVSELAKKRDPTADEKSRMADLQRQVDSIKTTTPYFGVPWANGVEESSLYVLPDGPAQTRLEYRKGEPRDLPVEIRGNPATPGPVVPRRFLAVLAKDKKLFPKESSGRLELAEAILGDAGPLAARVIVNRIWLHHFGRGLVDTPSNFGVQGSRPSHPELLDDLAARFVEHDWSIKWLHRELMLSAAYQMASTSTNETRERGTKSTDTRALTQRDRLLDPENQFLSRSNRKRLDFEAWRDSMLAVSGDLDRRIGGRSVELEDPANRRRTVYGTVHRHELSTMLRLHDFPEPSAHSPSRPITTTPLQQLFVLNSDFIHRCAQSLARRMESEVASGNADLRIQWLYQNLFARDATEFETAAAIEFINDVSSERAGVEAWRQYASVLLGSNEFVFVD